MKTRHGDPLAEPDRLIRRIYAYVAYIVGESADATEITCAAIERAVRHRASYNPKRESPLAWVFGITRFCVADRFREPFATTGDELRSLPERELPEGVDEASIRAAVARLGPRDRELIAMRYGAELTPREIGEQLGLRVSAVEVALQRAHGRIRSVLVPEPDRRLLGDRS